MSRTRRRTGQDVTDQYVDMQSRLTAKEAAADQLTKIMQNATKTEDVLAVYTQLQQIDSDIEVLKGQIKYTEQSAALSVHQREHHRRRDNQAHRSGRLEATGRGA